MDFLYFFNANIVFKTLINEAEFLPPSGKNLVAVLHPGFYNKKRKHFTYETNRLSSAYIAPDE
jgi:Glycosyltransferase family 6